MTPPDAPHFANDPNALPLDGLFQELAASGLVRRVLEIARDEDLGPRLRDITADVVAEVRGDRAIGAAVRARSAGVLAGAAAVPLLLDVFGVDAAWTALSRDGARFGPGDAVGELRGRARDVFVVERTLLDLLGRLSGVATLTDRYAERVAGLGGVRLLDTRKTTPGLRVLEKYAVRCGGGRLHRLGLHDAVLIKDNHLAGLDPDGVAELVREASRLARASTPPPAFVEVEVDDLEQLAALLGLPPGTVDIVLLDNMPPESLLRAVELRDGSGKPVLLEASGGVRLETIREIASTGVDRISVGAVTHRATSIDFGLDADNGPSPADG